MASLSLVGEEVVLAVQQQDERHALTRLLRAEGVTIHHASTGREVIHLIEDHRPRLVVLDAWLPDVHAWRLLASISELRPDPYPAIIVLSDAPITAPQQRARLVVRPVSSTTLKQIIREWVL